MSSPGGEERQGRAGAGDEPGGPPGDRLSGNELAEGGGDLDQVMQEIDEEVRARRAAGDFPPSFERRLDDMFARFTPVGVHEGHFGETLRLADRSAYIDIEVPVRSEKPGLGFVKRVLRRLMAWYLNYVVQQLTHFTSNTMRVLHMVDERLEDLEREVEASRPTSRALETVPAGEADLTEWVPAVTELLAKAEGRVLHADCGGGVLLAALAREGLDVYGLDARAELLDEAARLGLDVRRGDALEHLRSVSPRGLGGLVLSGFVDRLPLGSQQALVEVVAARLRPGARLVVLGTAPNAWRRHSSPVEADLSPGRPLHPRTWSHLLGEAGFVSLGFEWGHGGERLERVPGEVAGAAVINADLERLESLLLGPEHYLVTGVRGG